MAYFSKRKAEKKKELEEKLKNDLSHILKTAKEKYKEPEEEKDIHSIIDQEIIGIKKTPTEEENKKLEEEKKAADKNIVPIEYVEKISTLNITRAILYLTVLGILGIIFFTQYVLPTPAFLLLVWLFGTMCFLPLGLVLGWLFLNPDIRVLILRRFRGKNYGLVHFVHRGGQRMATRIKNFDDDIIISGTKMWILQNDGIYYLDRNRNLIKHAKIDPEHIKTMPANIPVIHLDPDTMIPLTFRKTISQSNPQQVGSTILGYIYNQIAKMLFLKKGLQIFFIIMIALCILNLVIGIQLATWMDEVQKEIPRVKELVTKLGEILSSLNITIPQNNITIPGG